MRDVTARSEQLLQDGVDAWTALADQPVEDLSHDVARHAAAAGRAERLRGSPDVRVAQCLLGAP